MRERGLLLELAPVEALELAPVEGLELAPVEALSVATYLPLGVLVIPGGGPLGVRSLAAVLMLSINESGLLLDDIVDEAVDGAEDEVVDGVEELSVLRFPIAVSRLEGIGGRFEEPEDEVVSEGLTLT